MGVVRSARQKDEDAAQLAKEKPGLVRKKPCDGCDERAKRKKKTAIETESISTAGAKPHNEEDCK